MSVDTSSPSTANSSATTATLNLLQNQFQKLEEDILIASKAIYEGEDGLCSFSRRVGLETFKSPRQKLNILLLGPSSSGKSSLANYLANDDIQRTGSSITTTGVHILTSGRRRQTIDSELSTKLFSMAKGSCSERSFS
ncbi:hypothetical protein GEMRC1_001533 [Eukaryota sp. GEM-RC1]